MGHAACLLQQHPRTAVRKGAAAAFRAWVVRTAGYHERKGIGSHATFSGEPIFRQECFRQSLRKLGGPKTLVAIPLRRGRVRDARKERQSLGRNANHTAARGDSRNELLWTWLPQAIRGAWAERHRFPAEACAHIEAEDGRLVPLGSARPFLR